MRTFRVRRGAGWRRLVALDLAALMVLAGLTGFLALLGRTNQHRIDEVERRGLAAAVFSDLGRSLERQHSMFIQFQMQPSDGARAAFVAELLATQRVADRHTLPSFHDRALQIAGSVSGPYAGYARAAIEAMGLRLSGSPQANAAASAVEDKYAALRDDLSQRRIAAEDEAAISIVALDRAGGLVRLWAPLIAAATALALVVIAVRSRRAIRRAARLEAERDVLEERERILTAAVRKEREAAAAAGEASRMKDGLVATVSHEFRSPLTSILGYSNTLRRQWELLPDHRRNEFLDMVERQARRLASMIDNLLTLSGLHQKAMFPPQHGDPLALTDVASGLAREFGLRGTHRLEIHAEADPLVAAGRSEVEHILTNLLDNACRYAPEGTVIAVTVGMTPETAFVSVRNDGPGIAPEHLPNLFEPFWRPPGQTKQGSGLGLAIVKGLAESAGGRVEVMSEPEEGTTFTVFLPLGDPDARRASAEVA